MGAGEQILAELATINAKLDRLLAGGASRGESNDDVAPISELDSDKGDREVRKDPPRWSGEPIAPRRMSLCPPEYLDVVAEFYKWKADKDEAKAQTLDGKEREDKLKYASYDRKDAARARGWAKRMRDGWKSPEAQEPADDFFGARP